MSGQTTRGSQPHTRAPGQLPSLPQYEVLNHLGGGGMGEIYQARHIHLDRTVVVKWLRADGPVNSQAEKRFGREILALAKVVHPNVVNATDAGIVDGRRYLVMEYIDGIDLSALRNRVGPLPIADACEIIRQAALGLAQAHQHGIVHRDIKPTNIMLAGDGGVKILDLGLALLQQDEDSEDPTLTSADSGPFGTYDYMSPEQWDDTHKVDHRTDLYSLGCTLYFLLCGHAPFGTERYSSPASKMRGHVLEDVPPIQELRPDVPDDLRDLVDHLLVKEPARRLGSAVELAERLVPFTSGSDLQNLISSVHGGGILDNESTTNSELRTVPGGSSARDAARKAAPPLSDGNVTRLSHSATAVATPQADRTRNRAVRRLVAGTLVAALFTAGAAAIFHVLNNRAAVVGPPVPLVIPSFEPIPLQKVREHEPASLLVTLQNIQELRGKVAFEVSPGAPNGLRIDPATGIIHWQPDEEDGGTGTAIEVTVYARSLDPGVESAETTVRFDVDEVNVAPVLTSISGADVRERPEFDTSVQEGRPLEMTLVAADTDLPPNPLHFDVESLPAGVHITEVENQPRTWRLRWIPDERTGGDTVRIPLRVFDGDEWSDVRTVVVRVDEANEAPDFATIGGEPLNEERSFSVAVDEGHTISVPIAGADVDLPENRLTLAAAGDETLPGGAQLVADDKNPRLWRFVWTPGEAQGGFGPFEIPLLIRDEDGASRQARLLVRVDEVNTPPAIAAIEPQSAGPGEEFILDINVSDADLPRQEFSIGIEQPEDVDAERLDWEWLSVEDGRPATLRVRWRLDTERDIGKRRVFTLRVTDNGQPPLAATRTFEVSVGRYVTNSIGMQLALIPAGEFRMGNLNPEQLEQLIPQAPEIPEREPGVRPLFGTGSPPGPPVRPAGGSRLSPNDEIDEQEQADTEEPSAGPESDDLLVRQLPVANAFYMGAHEVTQAQYAAVMGENPSFFSETGPGRDAIADLDPAEFPVESVTWEQAIEFCRRLSELPEEKKRGRVYRLPTEIEWEYACRAGTETMFHTGERLSSTQANFDGRYPPIDVRPGPFLRRSTTVGSYEPNAFGLYDMHGNVAEWCHDWYAADSYEGDVERFGPKEGDVRVVRGGSYRSQRAYDTRSAARDSHDPAAASSRIGFRVVCAVASRRIPDPDEPAPEPEGESSDDDSP